MPSRSSRINPTPAGSEDSDSSADSDKAFAGVELKEQSVESMPEAAEPEPEPLEEIVQPTGTRGYGERKHDEYAADVEASDALAEADIYIAYGRYSQAIELLKTAVAADPGNPTYRLKLLELYLQTDNRPAAEAELAELEAIGDTGSLDRARALMEIEGAGGDDAVADDLDLSADFSDDSLGGDDEDLVIAAEANGMSTKLDLARAYLDMGDEDGARQILEEVVAEGSAEQKSEASELLARID